MDSEQQDQWIDEVIRQVLAAMAHASELREAIVFKGAWILNAHLKDERHSLDIDANAACEWASANPLLEDQRVFFEKTIQRVVGRYFEKQSPIRFTVTGTKVEKKPRKEHPRNWTAFWVRIAIQDAMHVGVWGLPSIEIDIAAPEELGSGAVETIELLGAPAKVYSLHRIAGEKLRAYLTSLPEYRKKMRGGERAFRVKDLYDLARILRSKPINDGNFWNAAANEFKLACQSRLVDCKGADTFMQEWQAARSSYEGESQLRGVPFPEAEAALTTIVQFIVGKGLLPLEFSMDNAS